MEHVVAFAPSGEFAGWPANNGLWTWPDGEILTGCSVGPFVAQSGHNIGAPIRSVLLRSRDGGDSWTAEEPDGYLNDPHPPVDLDRPFDVAADGFAMRVVGTGYHGTDQPAGGFYLSSDRGHTWSGPYRLRGLVGVEPLCGLEMTPRTDYLVLDGELLAFISARDGRRWGSDAVFCARSIDGAQTFTFLSWVVPLTDPYRAVMPSTVQCGSRELISAIRRRDMRGNEGWIDAYASTDAGASWSFRSRVGETGGWNGNPPALARLGDGRLCCVYGNRTGRQIVARVSADNGQSWEAETVLRDDFAAVDDEPDLGYARLAVRADSRLVAVYYWATHDLPQQHIAATIWAPSSP